MDAGAGWKPQTVGNGINFGEDFVGTKVLRCELSLWSRSKERCWTVLQTQPSSFADLKLKFPMLAIIVMLVVLHSLKETVTNIDKELVAVCNVALHG